ncbi:MAG: MarR family transcriptional regulator [Fretibacterium sp.]|nr:MarR family transcriptional regulator [Fretibacterium sp.]
MYALDDGEPHSQKEISRQWLITRQTVNTITKRWEKEGLLVQKPIPGRRREMQILLTKAGRKYAEEFLAFIYQAEEKAIQKTIERYSGEFIEAIGYFAQALKEAFSEGDEISAGESEI